MRRLAAVVTLAITLVFPLAPTFAQGTSPGPYVVDIRTPISGIPSGTAFYPAMSASVLVPRRGFGGSIGGHVYPMRIGPARLGLGVDVVRARGSVSTPATAEGTASGTSTSSAAPTSNAPGGILSTTAPIDAAMTITAVAPQVSFNFGSREGWSYLGAGYGTVGTQSVLSGEQSSPLGGPARLGRTRRGGAFNVGGGARWFLRGHIAAGFDVRFHRMARPAPTTLVIASVGLSLR